MQRVHFVNAFTSDQPLSGNPAAVCVLSHDLSDQAMQNIARQHNLSETAFVVELGLNQYSIRWFTPTVEVDLCGHATLAAAHVLFESIGSDVNSISFQSASGPLRVERNTGGMLTLNFPARRLTPVSQNVSAIYTDTLRIDAKEILSDGHVAMLVCQDQAAVQAYQPNPALITALAERVLYLTAVGDNCDFVCRVFAPKVGIAEDPVTGSAYTSLTPYWASHYNQKKLTARQLSVQGGYLDVQLDKDRVLIGGQAQTIIKGDWLIPYDEH